MGARTEDPGQKGNERVSIENQNDEGVFHTIKQKSRQGMGPAAFLLVTCLFLSHPERRERGLINHRGSIKSVICLVGGERVAR
jgi:hypothetical protein